MNDHFSGIGHWVSIFDRLMKMYYNRSLSELEIGWGQQFYVEYLFDYPGAAPQEMMECIQADKATLTKIIKKLTEVYYIRVAGDEKDQRVKRLYLTEKASLEYARILTLDVPFAMMSTGESQLIWAGGSPKYAMFSTMLGAVMATITGQIVSAALILFYFTRFKIFRLRPRDFVLKGGSVAWIFQPGLAAGANQLAITLAQIIMNNILGHYGELFQYGRDIPLACVGIITKVNAIFNAVIFGIAQSMQPIVGYNYGAGNFPCVKDTFKRAAAIMTCISCTAFLCFQLFPLQITSLFGSGDALYCKFALRCFRIFLFCTFIAGVQILCAQFFPSVEKGGIDTFVFLSRQVFFLLPLVLVFPLFWRFAGRPHCGWTGWRSGIAPRQTGDEQVVTRAVMAYK